MTRILGLDVSLTATGLAKLHSTEDGWELTTSRYRTNPHLKGDTRALLERMGRIENHCWTAASTADLVVIEGPAFAAVGSSSKDLMGLWWIVYRAVCGVAKDVVIVPPSTLKKWATGKGNASKGQVAVGIHRTFPGERFGIDFAAVDDNEIDAVALAGIGCQLLFDRSSPFDLPQYRVDAMTGLAGTVLP